MGPRDKRIRTYRLLRDHGVNHDASRDKALRGNWDPHAETEPTVSDAERAAFDELLHWEGVIR